MGILCNFNDKLWTLLYCVSSLPISRIVHRVFPLCYSSVTPASTSTSDETTLFWQVKPSKLWVAALTSHIWIPRSPIWQKDSLEKINPWQNDRDLAFHWGTVKFWLKWCIIIMYDRVLPDSCLKGQVTPKYTENAYFFVLLLARSFQNIGHRDVCLLFNIMDLDGTRQQRLSRCHDPIIIHRPCYERFHEGTMFFRFSVQKEVCI